MKKQIDEMGALEADYEELKALLEIDQANLDTAVVRQPQLYLRAGELLSRAVDFRDAAKEKLAVTDAQEADSIRQDFSGRGKSFTKDVIADEVMLSEAHQAAHEHYERMRGFAARAAVLQSAFEDRSRMLGLLIRLYATDYFGSSPTRSVDDDARHKFDRAAIKAHIRSRAKK